MDRIKIKPKCKKLKEKKEFKKMPPIKERQIKNIAFDLLIS